MWVENICIETVKIIQQISTNFTISSTHTKCTLRSIVHMFWQFLTKSLTGTEKQSTALTKFYVTQIRFIRIFYRGRHLSEREIILFFLVIFFPKTGSFALTFREVFFILIVHLWSVEYKKRYHIKMRILCDIYNRSENVKSLE